MQFPDFIFERETGNRFAKGIRTKLMSFSTFSHFLCRVYYVKNSKYFVFTFLQSAIFLLDPFLVEEVLKDTKSWRAFCRELNSLHSTDTVMDSEECSDISVYVKTHNPGWRDIARAAYCCGEEDAMEHVFKCKIFN